MSLVVVRAAVAAAAAFAVLSPAAAQIFSDDVARENAAANAERLNDIIRIVENLRGQLGKIVREQQDLDRRLREIAGQVEESAAAGRGEVKTLESVVSRAAAEREKIAGDLSALRDRLADISEFVAPPPEREFYDLAIARYQREEYAAAADGFKKMLKYYSDGEFNANARYWMSRSFLAAGEYEAAAAAAQGLISRADGGDKIPDAMLTLAQAQRNLGQEEESRATLLALAAQHPTTLAADEARQLLAQ